MGDFIEVGFWIFVFIALALRNVANRAKAAQTQAPPPRTEVEPGGVAAVARGAARDPAAVSRSQPREPTAVPRSRTREPSAVSRNRPREQSAVSRTRPRDSTAASAPKRRSLLGDWAELAREVERQMQGATEAARAEAEPERTVVVPGRQVFPAEPTLYDASGPVTLVPETSRPAPPARRPIGQPVRSETHHRPELTAPIGIERSSRPHGLDRLERYDTLKRAVILSEILGTPPGLAEGEPRLGRWDPA